MESHGTARVSEIGALLVPRNSMEFLGTARVSEIGALQVPWNSMGLLVSAKLAYPKFHGLPWNSMELLVSSKLAHSQSHGIPWNCSCHRNWRIPSPTGFHGTARVIEIGAFQVPWNSMELLVSVILAQSKLHGIPWNCSCHRNWRIPSPTEFHGTARVIEIGAFPVPRNSMELLESSKLAHSKFHGIPWNCWCHRNWRIPSPTEFHGTARVIEIGAFPVPRNSMELLESSKLAHSKFHGIPWNCSCQ